MPETMSHPASEYAPLQPEELLHALADLEDRAPIELAAACAAHGDAMVDALRDAIDDDEAWGPDEPDKWWLLLHATFILGRIATESAGLLLVHLMRNMDEYGDTDLQDWVAGDWPALFANKPQCVIDAVRNLAQDDLHDWYIRCEAEPVVLDAGLRAGGQALEDAIDWAAALARDESDEWQFRICTAGALLDFPRPRHRSWLEAMAQEEQRRQNENDYGFAGMFTIEDVESAFALAKDAPGWRRRGDPWKFYDPEEIAARQQRWLDEWSDPDWDVPAPYVRPAPKVGRNELCPCGSGKKYKHCCLAQDEAAARGAPMGYHRFD